MDAVNI